MAERLGVVSDISAPPQGTNRPWTAKVGGRKVRFWGTAFESEDPSAALVTLRDAENRGKAVRVEGEEETRSGPKGSYTSFTASQVFIVDGVAAANGSAPAPMFQDSNRDRSIIAQVAYKIAATLAASGAIDAEGKLEGVKTIADFIFYSILETAEGKATGAAESKEWATP